MGGVKSCSADSEELIGKILTLVQFEGHYYGHSILSTLTEK